MSWVSSQQGGSAGVGGSFGGGVMAQQSPVATSYAAVGIGSALRRKPHSGTPTLRRALSDISNIPESSPSAGAPAKRLVPTSGLGCSADERMYQQLPDQQTPRRQLSSRFAVFEDSPGRAGRGAGGLASGHGTAPEGSLDGAGRLILGAASAELIAGKMTPASCQGPAGQCADGLPPVETFADPCAGGMSGFSAGPAPMECDSDGPDGLGCPQELADSFCRAAERQRMEDAERSAASWAARWGPMATPLPPPRTSFDGPSSTAPAASSSMSSSPDGSGAIGFASPETNVFMQFSPLRPPPLPSVCASLDFDDDWSDG